MTDKVVSLGKARVDRTGAALDWSPRDAVVEMLRLIDGGLNVDSLVICYDGTNGSSFQNATKNVKEAVGLLQVTQMLLVMRGHGVETS